jgi:hypothetical protein
MSERITAAIQSACQGIATLDHPRSLAAIRPFIEKAVEAAQAWERTAWIEASVHGNEIQSVLEQLDKLAEGPGLDRCTITKMTFVGWAHAIRRALRAVRATEAGALDSVFEHVRHMLDAGYSHKTKGYQLSDMSWREQYDHLREEVRELGLATNGQETRLELADVLGVLFHMSIYSGDTPQALATRLKDKLRERFDCHPDYVSIPLDAATRDRLMKQANGATLCGIPVEKLSRDDLLAAIGCMVADRKSLIGTSGLAIAPTRPVAHPG